ncbi:MAG: hypothetical protein JWO84_542 [Parcubacteria group bacterium]|nr:hypothetical protein [Parcubacteria group bacterium]
MNTKVIAAHVECVPAIQGLELIESDMAHLNFETRRLTGSDPCAPTGSHLLVLGAVSERYGHPYVHELCIKGKMGSDLDERLLNWLMANMNWTVRADTVCIVNPRRLINGRFEGVHLTDYFLRLHQICVQASRTVQ